MTSEAQSHIFSQFSSGSSVSGVASSVWASSTSWQSWPRESSNQKKRRRALSDGSCSGVLNFCSNYPLMVKG